MKKIITFLVASIFISNTFAQITEEVTTGAGYANEVYYSFENGSVTTSARNTWDIAFTTEVYDVSILANTANGVELYTYPNGDISDWDNTLEITDIENWTQMHNSIESWNFGAFNQNGNGGDFDYGWGVYNMGNHYVMGDSIYIMKLASGNYKKVAIMQKNSMANEWIFKYADLDGADLQEITFNASNYSNMQFIHYSIENQEFVEQEADKNAWQLLFTKYYDNTIPYFVSGVLANSTVVVQEVKADGLDQATFKEYDNELFTDNISTIGSDWKTFSGTAYECADDVVYFINDLPNNTIWKIYFTNFTGSSEGKYTFVQENLSATSVNENNSFSVIYPNPASDIINLIYDINGKTNISIYSITGKLVYNETVTKMDKLNKHQIDVSNFTSGIYNVVINSENKISTTKFIKK